MSRSPVCCPSRPRSGLSRNGELACTAGVVLSDDGALRGRQRGRKDRAVSYEDEVAAARTSAEIDRHGFIDREAGHEHVQQAGAAGGLDINGGDNKFVKAAMFDGEACGLRGEARRGFTNRGYAVSQHLGSAAQRSDHIAARIRDEKQSARLRDAGPDFRGSIADGGAVVRLKRSAHVRHRAENEANLTKRLGARLPERLIGAEAALEFGLEILLEHGLCLALNEPPGQRHQQRDGDGSRAENFPEQRRFQWCTAG